MWLTNINWKVKKPKSWDPLLETAELREDLEEKLQFAVSGDGLLQA